MSYIGINSTGAWIILKLRFQLQNIIQIMQPEEQPQLIINRIVLENFKSYYGRLEIGPFHHQFTSIVGPNGSGKSNLIESLLFVFGKKAAWMRLQKIHQLIHNSAKHHDVKKASVEVHFLENGSSEIKLKRTVHHTGQSNYEINGKHSTLDEVTTLLKEKGIDLTNNRFLILQGEVEQISLMKAKTGDPDKPGLLEYLEDIIGSNKYQEQIDGLLEQYLVLDAQRREKGEMMRVVEMDLEKLEPAKDKAVEFVRREQRHIQLQNVQQQIQNYKLDMLIRKLNGSIGNLQEQKNKMMQEFQKYISENQEVIQRYKEAKRNLDQKKEQHAKCEMELQELTQKDDRAKNEQRQVIVEQTRLNKKLEEVTKERSKCIDDANELEAELPGKKEQVKKLTAERESLEQLVEKLQQQHQAQAKALLDERQAIQNRLHEPLREKQKLVKSIETLKNKIAPISEPVDSGKGIAKSIDDCDQIISQLNALNKQLELTLQEVKGRQKDTQLREEEIVTRLRQCNEGIADIQGQMEGRNQAQTQANEQSHTIRTIMQAAQSGQLKGVIGRIGDLGYIDAKYDIAASTAFGGLNSILVENQHAAEQCVNFLRQNRIGRQTFMALDVVTKQVAHEMRKGFNAPQGSHRLFDLVRTKNDEYLPAFYKVMSNTLVCETLDIAKDLRFGKKLVFRYVTLDGKLIEMQGTMSGGGQPKRGALNTSAKGGDVLSAQENANLELKLKEAQKQRQQLEQELGNARSQLSILYKDYNVLNESYREKRIKMQEQQDLKQDLQLKIQRQQELIQEHANREKERKEIEKEILQLEKQIKDIDKHTEHDQKAMSLVDEKLKKAQSDELKRKKEELDKINEKLEQLKSEVNKGSRQLLNFEKTQKKLDQEEAHCQNELKLIQEKLNNFKKIFLENEDKAMQLVATTKVINEKIIELDQEYKKTLQRHQDLTQTIREQQSMKEKITKEIEENQQQVRKSQAELEQGKGKLTQVRLNYQEICEQYDFLNELDEIANWKVAQQENNLNNQSLINISMLDLDESLPDDARKRGATLAIDLKLIFDIKVTDDVDPEQLEQFCPLEKELGRLQVHLQAQLHDVTKHANIKDIDSFKVKFLEYKGRKADFEEVKNRLLDQKQRIDRLKKERYELFMHGFNIIGARLRDTYQTLTNGGDAELELVDTMDPFSEGISFSVRPKNKSWKQMSKLSGGEKTLSSLSLIFALHYYKPTPLYFFDEVDAALDYKNVSIVANFIKERTKNAQFIVISLRNNMFELANKLIGIYKTSDMTKTISIQPELVSQKINQRQENNENINKN